MAHSELQALQKRTKKDLQSAQGDYEGTEEKMGEQKTRPRARMEKNWETTLVRVSVECLTTTKSLSSCEFNCVVLGPSSDSQFNPILYTSFNLIQIPNLNL